MSLYKTEQNNSLFLYYILKIEPRHFVSRTSMTALFVIQIDLRDKCGERYYYKGNQYCIIDINLYKFTSNQTHKCYININQQLQENSFLSKEMGLNFLCLNTCSRLFVAILSIYGILIRDEIKFRKTQNIIIRSNIGGKVFFN